LPSGRKRPVCSLRAPAIFAKSASMRIYRFEAAMSCLKPAAKRLQFPSPPDDMVGVSLSLLFTRK
jgi:hypothetical protein